MKFPFRQKKARSSRGGKRTDGADDSDSSSLTASVSSENRESPVSVSVDDTRGLVVPPRDREGGAGAAERLWEARLAERRRRRGRSSVDVDIDRTDEGGVDEDVDADGSGGGDMAVDVMTRGGALELIDEMRGRNDALQREVDTLREMLLGKSTSGGDGGPDVEIEDVRQTTVDIGESPQRAAATSVASDRSVDESSCPYLGSVNVGSVAASQASASRYRSPWRYQGQLPSLRETKKEYENELEDDEAEVRLERQLRILEGRMEMVPKFSNVWFVLKEEVDKLGAELEFDVGAYLGVDGEACADEAECGVPGNISCTK